MLRRAASGHMPAMQLSKLEAACRIASAVIRGWPEAPSSPLQGKGPLGKGPLGKGPFGAGPLLPGTCAGALALAPENSPPNRLERPPPLCDCARACPGPRATIPTMAATKSALALLRAKGSLRLAISHLFLRNQAFRRPLPGFQ